MGGMIRFTHYYGHDIYVVPARVLYVEDGGCGSRGLSVRIHLDTGEKISVSGRVDYVQERIAKALACS